MFSVVIPLYNKEKFIERCLNSVMGQSFKNFEVIVVDDGSTDKGAELVAKKYPNVKLIRKKNGGVSSARNVGITYATKNYVAFLDADDKWSSIFLNVMNLAILKSPEAVIIGSSYTCKENELASTVDNSQFRLINNYFDIALNNTLYFTSAVVVKK